MYITEDRAAIRVAVNGVPIFGNWATLSGGAKTAASVKTRPGGMGDEVAVGGQSSRDDLTCTTQFTDVVAAQHTALENQYNDGVTVTISWLAKDKSVIPNSGFTRTGTLQEVMEPDSTNDGTPAVGMYTLVMSCDEAAS
jgi:hypothetical protein